MPIDISLTNGANHGVICGVSQGLGTSETSDVALTNISDSKWRGSPVQKLEGSNLRFESLARPIIKRGMMELPNYSTKPNMIRILFPKILLLLVLSALLYFGVRINFIVFSKEFPTIINVLVIMAIVVLVIIEVILTNKKVKDSKIYFFNDRIELREKEQATVMLSTVSKIDLKKNLFDKLLNTGTLVLSTGQTIENINYPERIKAYITQLMGRYPAAKKKI